MTFADKFDSRLVGWMLACPYCEFKRVIQPDTQLYMLVHHCPGAETLCEGCGKSGQTPMHKGICNGHGEQFDETKLA